jgi:hypothetical protein
MVMADVLAEVLDANNRYAGSFGAKGKLPCLRHGTLPS